MKRIIAIAFIAIFSLTLSNQTIAQVKISKVPIEWLAGEQPKLLSAMANSPSSREQLAGNSRSLTSLAGGWHAQAISQYKDYVYVAFSDGTKGKGDLAVGEKNPAGKLWIYNIKTKESKIIDLEKGYAHPCSIQITGNYLAITTEAEYGVSQGLGVERERRSLIQIFDLSKDPNCSVEVGRISQDDTNSGGGGLTYSPVNKCWYMLVDMLNHKKVALYKTTDEKLDSWQKEPVAYYKRYGTGAGLNLITASDNSIWGLYYGNSELHGKNLENFDIASDHVRLFKIMNPDGKTVAQRDVYKQIVNVSSPRVKGAGELLADRPGMRFGASLRYEGSNLELLVCQRNMNEIFNIDRVPLKEGNRSQVMFANLAKAKGEIYASSVSNASQSFHLKKNQSESESVILQSPIKGDVNYFSEKSVSSSGFGGLKSLKKAVEWTDALEAQSNAPLVFFYLEGLTDINAQMIEFKAEKETDTKLE
ncbi:hypothetical protein SAMN05421640_3637 [Ekhidna lutea]|uniref:Uncharacterized protein n=1 Tax=Ekhidna lutea TaxID=447679 RepID=A0A239M6Q7_EKHLU|nr:hypothetical protein [Ekhidna lutea]SNT37828.1 hypothetical protein SAMN05421640_3637 [Ekhidna lutea]